MGHEPHPDEPIKSLNRLMEGKDAFGVRLELSELSKKNPGSMTPVVVIVNVAKALSKPAHQASREAYAFAKAMAHTAAQ